MTGATCWSVGGASVRGPAHVRRNAPNQDAMLWLPAQGQGGQIVAAVSDGHGGPAHVRSDVGSQLAVQSAADVLDWFLHGEMAPSELPGATVAAWSKAVQAHAAGQDEWLEPASDVLLLYGATLIALAAGETALTIMQVGDGDLFLGYPDGRVERPLPDDEGLVGEQTHSLCLPDAPARFRVAVIGTEAGAAQPDFALLATDGVSKSFSDEAAVLEVVRHYRQTLLGAELAAVLPGLPDWLSEMSRRGSGDDATLCLAIRRPA